MGFENIQVTIENFGASSQTDFSVSFSIDGGAPTTEIVAGPLAGGATLAYIFSATADFSGVGTYDVMAYTSLAGDEDLSNDTTEISISHFSCAPTASCAFGDGFTNFTLGSINNTTGCSPDGYGDYTALSTDLARGVTHGVSMTSGYSPQYVSIWIDFNDNNYFEASEKLVSAFPSDYGGSTTLAISGTAALGEHLLRAKSSDVIANVGDPCSDMTYGETEDYIVNIVAGPGDTAPIVDFIADIILGPPTTLISFTDLSTGSPTDWAWTITPAAGLIYTGGTSAASENPEVIFNEVGVYTVKLDASNPFGTGTETKTNYITITTFDEIVENSPFGLELVQKEDNRYFFNLNGSNEPFNVEIHDAMGRLIYNATISPSAVKTPFTIDLSGEAAGYYLIHVSDSNNSKVQKLWVR